MFSPWTLLGEVITVAMLVCTPFLWRRRGAAFGLRWAAVALLPAGFALTGLFRLFGTVGRAFFTFFSRTAFAPTVWMGYALIAAAVVVWVVARAVSSRGGGMPSAKKAKVVASSATAPTLERSSRASSASVAGEDDDFADVEAILRRRGI